MTDEIEGFIGKATKIVEHHEMDIIYRLLRKCISLAGKPGGEEALAALSAEEERQRADAPDEEK